MIRHATGRNAGGTFAFFPARENHHVAFPLPDFDAEFAMIGRPSPKPVAPMKGARCHRGQMQISKAEQEDAVEPHARCRSNLILFISAVPGHIHVGNSLNPPKMFSISAELHAALADSESIGAD